MQTEASKRPVPIDAFVAEDLLIWYRTTKYIRPADYVFATDAPRAGKNRGKQPVWISKVMSYHVQPGAMRSGITKHIGWHTFRHTYTTLLHANGEDVKVLQELLRRGSAKIAMDVYAQAVTARWQADGQHSLKSKNETPKIRDLTRALEEEVATRPIARRLMTHPGVGVLTALAFKLVIGTPERFACGKQIASYVGLVPSEESSGDRRRLGHTSKQGNALLRFLLVEAAQVTVRSQPEWRSTFVHLAMRRGRKIAEVAMARKLAVHLYWMWRRGCSYDEMQQLGSHAGAPGHPDGVQ